MQVVSGLRRWVVVDDHRKQVNVNSSGSDVGGDEYLDLTALYTAQGTFTLGLGSVTVQGHGRNPTLFKLPRQTVGAVLGAGEDNCALVLVDNVRSDLGALVASDTPKEVVHVIRCLFANHVMDNCVGGELTYEGFHVWAHSGGEEHDVTVVGCRPNDSTNRGEKSHVGHAIGLIDHHGRNRRQIEGTLLQHVFESPGTGHDDVNAEVQGFARHVIGGSTVDADDTATAVVGQLGNLFLHLGGEFARRYQDEAGRFAGTSFGQSSHERKTESQGLARTGRRFADDVAASQGVGKGGLLNGKGFSDTPGAQALDEVRWHTEVGKGQ